MKRICVALVAGIAATGAQALDLAAAGQAKCVIVVPEKASAPVQTAAQELADHLKLTTGATFQIVPEGTAGTTPRILVGPCQETTRRVPDAAAIAAKPDGIRIRTLPDALVLTGAEPRGTLYAVYAFLEDVVGCRWWTSAESFAPKRADLSVPELDISYAPKLLYREAFYRDALKGPFAARLRTNGHFAHISPEFGGHYEILGWCHTFYQLLPPDTYFADHPEWYSMINGKRMNGRYQLCLANDEMRAELTRRALGWIRKKPQAGIISISQNDWHGRCECPACKALEEKYGGPSGALIHFVNQVAADLEREFPGILVETLAYQYTRQAPTNVRPRDNVIVRLCSIECSYAQPLATGEQNVKFRQDIERWKAAAPRLYIWNYVTNFRHYILPHPNLRSLAPDIRFFVDSHAVGLFEQGDAGCSVGDFVQMRAWVLSHLMWNPDLDESALIDEFLNGYYGAAGPLLRRYLDFREDAVAKAGTFLRCYMADTSAWLSGDQLVEASKLYAQAEAAVADQPELAARVRRERLALDHAWLQRWHTLEREARLAGKPFAGPKDPKALCDEFVALCNHYQANQYREGGSFAGYAARLAARFGPPAKVPEICRNLPEGDWLDVQDGEFTLHGEGRWATAVADPKASDGRAIRMPGNHPQWAVQWPVSRSFDGTQRWHVYVAVRCEGDATDGQALSAGLYDGKARRGRVQTRVDVAELADGEYHLVDLGVQAPSEGCYMWVAPPDRAAGIRAVYVDRMLFLRAPK
jgi:hypothetical protein